MRQNAFGGRAPPGPLGELERSPRPPSRNRGKGCLLLREWEGEEGPLHPTLLLGPQPPRGTKILATALLAAVARVVYRRHRK